MLSIRPIHEAVDKQRSSGLLEEFREAHRTWRTIEQPIEDIILFYGPSKRELPPGRGYFFQLRSQVCFARDPLVEKKFTN